MFGTDCNVEQIVIDWHNSGHTSALPWTRLRRILAYLARFPTDTYAPYHLRTAICFRSDALQFEYWLIVRVLFDEFERTQSNIIVRTIQRNTHRQLSYMERAYYGRTLLIQVSAHVGESVGDCSTSSILHTLVHACLQQSCHA